MVIVMKVREAICEKGYCPLTKIKLQYIYIFQNIQVYLKFVELVKRVVSPQPVLHGLKFSIFNILCDQKDSVMIAVQTLWKTVR